METGQYARKTLHPEQIISKLREAKVLLSQGKATVEICRALKVSEQTYYRLRKEYGGMGTEQAHRLKRLVADLSLDKVILRATMRENF